ncbi:MAG TPA: hypothetical protein VMZ52_09930 [Bryobacteraceae bacterium]|nr:hypothetical protein [Bryobacteraceae bacterium]
MKKLLVISSLFAVSAFAVDMKGVISDAKCGAAHADASAKAQKCVAGCVKSGQAAVFVTEGKVLKIDDASKVADYLGQKVVVSGTADGESVKIDSIKKDE